MTRETLDQDRARRHFDRAAPGYARAVTAGPLALLRWTERRALFALLEPRSGERILDAGCGAGVDAVRLRALGCDVEGVDLSPAMVAQARARGIAAKVADLHQLDLDRRYSKILCAGPLEFCSDPGAVIERLSFHLEPRGRLVVLFPTSARGGGLYRRYYRTLGIRIRLFEVEEVLALLGSAGLQPAGVRRPASFSVAASAEKPA